MKKLALLIVLAFIVQSTALPQSCLPEGITFSLQTEIDSFQINYPGCTEIEGDLTIIGSNINNLSGLNILTSIGGFLNIKNTRPLMDLKGLEQLTSIGGELLVGNNFSLESLSGLDNLISIGGDLYIYDNDSLMDLLALSNLSSINGDFWIIRNDTLSSLSGLDNIDVASIGNMGIYFNPNLSNCEAHSICSYLGNPNGVVIILGNAPGCKNPPNIANSCGTTLSCLPYGDYYFHTQSEIDDFETDYSGCTTLNGDTEISGSNIVSLSGLGNVTTVDGNLTIGGDLGFGGTDSLVNLDGIGNISEITGDFELKNNWALTSLTDFNELTTIGGSLYFLNNFFLTNLSGLENITSIDGTLALTNNDNLTDLSGLKNITSTGYGLLLTGFYKLSDFSGLESLTSVEGLIGIYGNHSLTSLKGLENIESESITELQISHNDSLATCDIISICEFLASPGGEITINDNLEGCNTKEEILEACADWVMETDTKSPITIYPNPAKNELTISNKNGTTITELTIYNQLGQKVLHKTGITNSIDVSTLQQGIYIIEIVTNELKIREKLIVSE